MAEPTLLPQSTSGSKTFRFCGQISLNKALKFGKASDRVSPWHQKITADKKDIMYSNVWALDVNSLTFHSGNVPTLSAETASARMHILKTLFDAVPPTTLSSTPLFIIAMLSRAAALWTEIVCRCVRVHVSHLHWSLFLFVCLWVFIYLPASLCVCWIAQHPQRAVRSVPCQASQILWHRLTGEDRASLWGKE